MNNITTYYCKKCGAPLPMSGVVVSKHYEKFHFSEWAANRDTIVKYPQAFLSTRRELSSVKSTVKPHRVAVQPDVERHREANKHKILNKVSECIDSFVYREGKAFNCPCCLRTLSSGMRIIVSREERFTLCYDCYRSVKAAIPKKGIVKEVLVPFGGMTTWKRGR